MKVEVEIGQVHRFELREALLIYREGRRSFITRHEVLAQKQGPPLLGAAQPLTTAFVENLAESLGGSAAAEVLSENILAKSDRMMAWWTPRRQRQMYFENPEGKMQKLNGKRFPQPPPRQPEHSRACRKQAAYCKDKAGRGSFLESLG